MVVVGCRWWCLCLLLCAFLGVAANVFCGSRVLRRPVIPCSCGTKSQFFVHTVVWLFWETYLTRQFPIDKLFFLRYVSMC